MSFNDPFEDFSKDPLPGKIKKNNGEVVGNGGGEMDKKNRIFRAYGGFITSGIDGNQQVYRPTATKLLS